MFSPVSVGWLVRRFVGRIIQEQQTELEDGSLSLTLHFSILLFLRKLH